MAASDIWFSNSSSSMSDSAADSAGSFPPSVAAVGARQQLDGAHLAQIQADGIVGALAGLGLLDFGDGLLRDLDQFVVGLVLGLFLVFFLAVGVLGLGDVDAHF